MTTLELIRKHWPQTPKTMTEYEYCHNEIKGVGRDDIPALAPKGQWDRHRSVGPLNPTGRSLTFPRHRPPAGDATAEEEAYG